MRSGSFNVIYITFSGLTLPGRFREQFEAFTATKQSRQVAFNSP
jgi:hypothetical protein